MAETWRLITTWGASPAFNMGLDEALLFARRAPLTLRFYTWSPDTLSLGYFQRLADVPAAGRAGALVRRITGGGAIHHQGELTFSIAADLDHPLYRGAVHASYSRVHALIARALERYAVAAVERGATPLASDRPDTGMCFHASTPQDLVWGSRKGVGSAQRRRDGRVLHHGSIKLATTPLEGDIACVGSPASAPSAQEVAETLREVIEEDLGVRCVRGVPSPAERADAEALGRRYVDPAFVRRR